MELNRLPTVTNGDTHPSPGHIKEAQEAKDRANTLLKDQDYIGAISMYTKAIDLDGTKAVYWANRAQAQIKVEAFGLAIADATKAIEVDANHIKAYYRRAIANTAILKPKEALKDFHAVVRRAPSNKDAKQKLADCQKLLRRLEFEKAIEVQDAPSAFEGLEWKDVAVEASYDGTKLEDDMTQGFIDDMIERFRKGKRIHRRYVLQILATCQNLFLKDPTMVEREVEKDAKLTVCGDTHGQFFDLLHIFDVNGFPSSSHAYLFNGDFVDRGSWSTEVALLLYALKCHFPTSLFLNRGNHETDDMNKVYGFEGECKAKYNERIFRLFSESFSALPLATLIGKKYLVLHGGLFSDDKITLDDIRKLNRHARRQPGQEGLMMEMLWTDPQPQPGRGPSKRGVGLQFGPDVTKRFCKANNLSAIIRSHEVRMGGYEVEHGGQLITVFSAPNYCDSQGNKGAFINIGSDLKLVYQTFDAVPHPNVKPMAYASGMMQGY